MPAAGFVHHRRDPALVERDLKRYRDRNPALFPDFERAPDLSRGDQRLAAEVVLAELAGTDVPSFVHERAVTILATIARG